MSKIFNCPSCGASLDFDGGDHATVRCSYCGNTVIVPESMRSKSPNVTTLFTQRNQLSEIVNLINDGNQTEAVDLYSKTFKVSHEDAHSAVNRLAAGLSLNMDQIHVQNFSIRDDPNIKTYRSQDKTGRTIGCLILFIVLFTVGIILVTTLAPLLLGGAALTTIFSSDDPLAEIGQVLTTVEATGGTIESGGSFTLPGISSTSIPNPTMTPSVANLTLSFGTEGIAPGQLNDARALAVAPGGDIYVADRDSGRLQIFNSEGMVQGQWAMNDEKFIDGLAIDRSGYLYTIESSDIFRYDQESGEQLAQYTYPEIAVSFSSIAATVDGQLVAINRIRGEIIRFDQNGNPILLNSAENIPDANGFDTITVDGNGRIYVLGNGDDALGDRQDMVFVFNSDGEYITRFGQSGNNPGTFRSPNAIAVDGQGRIYIGDIFGVHIFTNNGSYIDFFEIRGSNSDMEINESGQLVVSIRTSIHIYDMNFQ